MGGMKNSLVLFVMSVMAVVAFATPDAMPVKGLSLRSAVVVMDAPPPKGCDPILCAEFGFMCECTTKPTK
jgi:hypothetical protein